MYIKQTNKMFPKGSLRRSLFPSVYKFQATWRVTVSQRYNDTTVSPSGHENYDGHKAGLTWCNSTDVMVSLGE